MRKFLAVLDARNKEFIRDRAAAGWNVLFPVLVIFGFAFAFSDGSQDILKVSLVSESSQANPISNSTSTSSSGSSSTSNEDFRNTRYIQFISGGELKSEVEKLKRHKVDMVLALDLKGTGKYWVNSTSPKGYLAEKILLSSPSARTRYQKQLVEGRETRYVDWLISGLLAMNMMFSALFGVGYNIVRYRKNGVLKRLKATPLSAFEFILAQVVSRLFLIVGVTTVVYLGCHYFIHFQMLGSYLNLFLVLVLGALCLISLGLLMACRVSSEEFAGGILNLISWPMMFLSGVWFSLEGANPIVKKASQIFPLTHVIDASRAIMTEGAGLQAVSYNLVMLLCMTCVFLLVSSVAFKWK